MQGTLFQLLILLSVLLISSHCLSIQCNIASDVLQCPITNTLSTVDTSSYNSNQYNSITITYSGSTNLTLISPSIKPISITPVDQSDNNVLQISTINTNASRIDIRIRLSQSQVPKPLFSQTCNVAAPSSTISIKIAENGMNSSSYKIFYTPSSSTMNFANYELIFDQTLPKSGTLYMYNVIRDIANINSITISGNGHYLAVDSTQIPQFSTVTVLSLKYLRLYDRILDNFINLQQYYIEGCEYNGTAQFLKSSRTYSLSLTMVNNTPTDLVLPNHPATFQDFNKLISLTLIEPKLNSTCLKTISPNQDIIYLALKLGLYATSDFDSWISTYPRVYDLKINDVPTLDLFSPRFFSKLQAISQITLSGSFSVRKKDICIFYLINIQPYPKVPIIILDNGAESSKDDTCTDIYVEAINQRTMETIKCPGKNTCDDCRKWAQTVQNCSLISTENSCSGTTNTITGGNHFSYNGSYLYYFFQNNSCTNQQNQSGSSTKGGDSVNIGAIIGALCGLLVAIVILGATIFFVCRSRRNRSTDNAGSNSEKKYKLSSSDPEHLSIATSKSSKSSRYQLQKSFFPAIQPNDEIAPPLYTAPSESVASASNYGVPPRPSAPRASVSTHATHVYETLDN